MPDTIPALAVRKSVTAEVPAAHAFEVFTSGFDSWWPRSHHIAKGELLAAVIEPKVGGRWYERGVDGSECDWGRVLAYEPPSRIVLSWHLNGRFEFDPDPAHASEIEVRFIPDGSSRTRVELEHRYIERSVEAEALHKGVGSDGGWAGLLAAFAEKARATAE